MEALLVPQGHNALDHTKPMLGNVEDASDVQQEAVQYLLLLSEQHPPPAFLADDPQTHTLECPP